MFSDKLRVQSRYCKASRALSQAQPGRSFTLRLLSVNLPMRPVYILSNSRILSPPLTSSFLGLGERQLWKCVCVCVPPSWAFAALLASFSLSFSFSLSHLHWCNRTWGCCIPFSVLSDFSHTRRWPTERERGCQRQREWARGWFVRICLCACMWLICQSSN